MGEARTEAKKIFCNTCRRLTNHFLKARYSLTEDMTEDKYDWPEGKLERVWEQCEPVGTHVHRYSLWSCAGCTVPTVEWELGVQNSDFEDDFEPSPASEYFPSRSKGSIPEKTFRNLKPDMARLYREVVSSFNNDCLISCTIGLRSLLEAICSDKGTAGADLDQKIDSLIRFLPSLNIIEALQGVRLTGNRAAHGLEALTRSEAASAIEVMEDLLNFFYDLDYKASRVKNPMKAATKSGNLGQVQ